jgi:hypothetical protein
MIATMTVRILKMLSRGMQLRLPIPSILKPITL